MLRADYSFIYFLFGSDNALKISRISYVNKSSKFSFFFSEPIFFCISALYLMAQLQASVHVQNNCFRPFVL